DPCQMKNPHGRRVESEQGNPGGFVGHTNSPNEKAPHTGRLAPGVQGIIVLGPVSGRQSSSWPSLTALPQALRNIHARKSKRLQSLTLEAERRRPLHVW